MKSEDESSSSSDADDNLFIQFSSDSEDALNEQPLNSNKNQIDSEMESNTTTQSLKTRVKQKPLLIQELKSQTFETEHQPKKTTAQMKAINKKRRPKAPNQF